MNVSDYWIDAHTNVSAFKYSTPFTVAGSAHGSITAQHKRNIVLYVAHPFPYILTAQPVVRRVETILSPIQSATEDVSTKTSQLAALLTQSSLTSKTLTLTLKGCIAPEVNSGVLEICSHFLAPPSSRANGAGTATAKAVATGTDASTAATATDKTEAETVEPPVSYDVAHQEELRLCIRSFVATCERGLDVNKSLSVTESEKEFHSTLTGKYGDLLALLKPYLSPAPPATGGHSRRNKKSFAAVRFDVEGPE